VHISAAKPTSKRIEMYVPLCTARLERNSRLANKTSGVLRPHLDRNANPRTGLLRRAEGFDLDPAGSRAPGSRSNRATGLALIVPQMSAYSLLSNAS
jgi:hypothetical protein